MKIKLLVEEFFSRPSELKTEIKDFNGAMRYIENITASQAPFYVKISKGFDEKDPIKFEETKFAKYNKDSNFLADAQKLRNDLLFICSSIQSNPDLEKIEPKLTEMHIILKAFIDKWSTEHIAAFTDEDLRNLSNTNKDVRKQGLEKLCGTSDSVLTLNGFKGLSMLKVLNTDDKLARKFVLSAGISEINNKKSYILKGLDAASYGDKYYNIAKTKDNSGQYVYYRVNANPNPDGTSNIIQNANDFINVYNILLNNKHALRSAKDDFMPIANEDFYKLTQDDQGDFLSAYYAADADRNKLLNSLADKTFRNFASENEDGVKAIKKAITGANEKELAAAIEDEAVKDALNKALKK